MWSKKCTYSYSISWSPSSIITPGSVVGSSPLNKSQFTSISPSYSTFFDKSSSTSFYDAKNAISSSVFYSSICYSLAGSPLSLRISCNFFIFESTYCYSSFLFTLPFILGSSFAYYFSYLLLFLSTFFVFDFCSIIVAFLSAIILIW